MAAATCDDYAWFQESFPWWAEMGYCITLVENITASDLIASLAPGVSGETHGILALAQASDEPWDATNDDTSGVWFATIPEYTIVGATTLDDGWTLMVEYNGWVGITDDVMEPITRSHQVVSHYRNVNAVDRFTWWRDGAVQVTFEPLFATDREGENPQLLVDTMREVGFEVDDPDAEIRYTHSAAAFALAERITGVGLSADLLDDSTYLLGRVPNSALKSDDDD